MPQPFHYHSLAKADMLRRIGMILQRVRCARSHASSELDRDAAAIERELDSLEQDLADQIDALMAGRYHTFNHAPKTSDTIAGGISGRWGQRHTDRRRTA